MSAGDENGKRDCIDFQLIETMRHNGLGVVKSLNSHLDRAESSAAFFGFYFERQRIVDAIRVRFANSIRVSRLRLLMFSNGHFSLTESCFPERESVHVRLELHPEPLDTDGFWTVHKTSRREPYDRRRAMFPFAGDVILKNGCGELMETCSGNLAVLIDGVWRTPPLESGCLPGVERQRLLKLGMLDEFTLTERYLSPDRPLAVVNSLRGWRAAHFVPS